MNVVRGRSLRLPLVIGVAMRSSDGDRRNPVIRNLARTSVLRDDRALTRLALIVDAHRLFHSPERTRVIAGFVLRRDGNKIQQATVTQRHG